MATYPISKRITIQSDPASDHPDRKRIIRAAGIRVSDPFPNIGQPGWVVYGSVYDFRPKAGTEAVYRGLLTWYP